MEEICLERADREGSRGLHIDIKLAQRYSRYLIQESPSDLLIFRVLFWAVRTWKICLRMQIYPVINSTFKNCPLNTEGACNILQAVRQQT